MASLQAVFLCLGITTVAAQTLPTVVTDLGLGYNVIYANTDGTSWKSGGEDPGLLLTRHVLRMFHEESTTSLPDHVLYESHAHCQTHRTDDLVFNAQTYQQKLASRLSFDGPQIHGLNEMAFTKNGAFETVQHETETLNYVFQDVTSTCVQGSLRYQRLSTALLSQEFMEEVCALPEVYDEAKYIAFIDTWGTHVVTGLTVGNRQTDRDVIKRMDYVKRILMDVPSDVSISGSLHTEQSRLVDVTALKHRPQFPFSFPNSPTYTLYTGIYVDPSGTKSSTIEPIGFKLTSLDAFFENTYWSDGANELPSSCPRDISRTISVKRPNLVHALQVYGARKGAFAPVAGPLQVPVVWPQGTYSLVSPRTGCPTVNHTSGANWESGWMKQTPERQSPSSSSNVTHMKGPFTNIEFNFNFCTLRENNNEFALPWPKGNYCIQKYKTCPSGFSEGFVKWDDDDTDNGNAHGGVVPDGEYGADTKLFYCCRYDGETYHAIDLPFQKPFYLFQYKGGCQEVRGMTSSVESVLFDDEDSVNPTTAAIGNVHPNMMFSNAPQIFNCPAHNCGSGSRMYYCYYEYDTSSAVIIGK